MKFINPQVDNDIKNGKLLNLDLGAGGFAGNGYFAVDHLPLEGVDILADLNQPLSLLPDDSVALVRSRHTFEHIQNLLPLMDELYRIVSRNGLIKIIVPHFSNVYAFSDPTHVRFFGLFTMYYFASLNNQPFKRKVPDFYTKSKFLILNVNIRFYKQSYFDKIIGKILYKLVNSSIPMQVFYERRLSQFFHASEIEYNIAPDK